MEKEVLEKVTAELFGWGDPIWSIEDFLERIGERN